MWAKCDALSDTGRKRWPAELGRYPGSVTSGGLELEQKSMQRKVKVFRDRSQDSQQYGVDCDCTAVSVMNDVCDGCAVMRDTWHHHARNVNALTAARK